MENNEQGTSATERQPQIGDHVVFVDSLQRECQALVTAVWGTATYPYNRAPSINVVTVHLDAARGDQYGRQIERFTSVAHQSGTTAPGYYWRW